MGQAVIQLAASHNINTINIVRDRWGIPFVTDHMITPCRPDIEEMKCYLGNLGATVVITEEENSKRDIKSVYEVIRLSG